MRLAEGTAGFVSEAWTRIEAGAEAPLAAPTGSRAGVSGWLTKIFSRSERPQVELVIRDPGPETLRYRHTESELPVAGFAKVENGGTFYDIVLALDGSTSTNEYAEADVNGDGKQEDAWKGRDSIYAAQLVSARSFLRTVERMPRNRRGERIRVGIVTYSGEEQLRLHGADRERPLTLQEILRLARRDARVTGSGPRRPPPSRAGWPRRTGFASTPSRWGGTR